mmetsp:Transcript_62332/g.146448  ORF Transcript_62332/g.146448 Transcript_62332/m.146448 type:complete len:354 (-) Transcript_62332:197-1258(-)
MSHFQVHESSERRVCEVSARDTDASLTLIRPGEVRCEHRLERILHLLAEPRIFVREREQRLVVEQELHSPVQHCRRPLHIPVDRFVELRDRRHVLDHLDHSVLRLRAVALQQDPEMLELRSAYLGVLRLQERYDTLAALHKVSVQQRRPVLLVSHLHTRLALDQRLDTLLVPPCCCQMQRRRTRSERRGHRQLQVHPTPQFNELAHARSVTGVRSMVECTHPVHILCTRVPPELLAHDGDQVGVPRHGQLQQRGHVLLVQTVGVHVVVAAQLLHHLHVPLCGGVVHNVLSAVVSSVYTQPPVLRLHLAEELVEVGVAAGGGGHVKGQRPFHISLHDVGAVLEEPPENLNLAFL